MEPFKPGQRVRVKRNAAGRAAPYQGELGTVKSARAPGWTPIGQNAPVAQWSYHLDLDCCGEVKPISTLSKGVRWAHDALEPVNDEEKSAEEQAAALIKRISQGAKV